jgi:hypothetical protein
MTLPNWRARPPPRPAGRARRAAGQPGHARRTHRAGAAPLPGRIPERPARGRDPAPGVAAHPARHHPAHTAGQVGRQVRQRSGCPRARRWRCGRSARPSAARPRLAQRGHDVLVRHAMRYGNPSVASGDGRVARRGATASWCCRCTRSTPRHHRQRGRRGACSGRWIRAACPNCASSANTTTTPATSRAGRQRLRALAAARPRPKSWCSASTACPSAACLGDPYHCQCHKTARLLAERWACRPHGRHLPEPLRQGQVAGALYRAHAA